MSAPATQQAHGGQADAYFNDNSQDIGMQNRGYQQGNYQQQQPQYNQDPNAQYNQQYPPQPPPGYGKQNESGFQQGEKQDFSQAFSITKPKYNDIWAALLFVATFCGFTAVSGLALHGYSSTISGGGIYGNRNSFGLNSNTMILL